MNNDFIYIPSYLLTSKNNFNIVAMANCDVVIQDCGNCEDCQSTCERNCQTTCQDVCQYSWESCGNCEIACMVCESNEGCCMDDCEDFCMGGCQVCESTNQTPEQLPDPVMLTGLTFKTHNSLKITIEAVTGADTYYARINGGNTQSSSSRVFTFTGLQQNTQYLIEIKVGGIGWTDSNWVSYYATTTALTPWEWLTPKTTGIGFNVTRTEWLAFCEKINEIRVSYNLAVYDFTIHANYIDKGKTFFAWIFVQASTAINQINGLVATECLNVTANTQIKAWYFENLKTALNSAINALAT